MKGNVETQQTKFNEKIIETKNIIKPESLNFENDGVQIEGFVLKPVNYDENDNYEEITESVIDITIDYDYNYLME